MGDTGKKKTYTVSKIAILGTVAAVMVLILGAVAITYFATRGAYKASSAVSDVQEEVQLAPKQDPEALRLHNKLRPLSYALTLKVNLPGYKFVPDAVKKNNLTIEGNIRVQLDVIDATNKIELNMKKLNILPGGFVESDGKVVKVIVVEVLEEFEKVTLHLAEPIQAEKAAFLSLNYTGQISELLGGMYQAKYTTTTGESKIAAVTQMEPTDARATVPCFDEPEYKAVWNVTIIHPKGTNALGNGIEIGTTDFDEQFSKTSFESTPKMSSYLLAMIVSDFVYIEKTTQTGVRMRVYARPDAKDMTSYALESGVKVLEFYEKYYNISFPLKKQDMVAIPDFAAGAMENWGLVTYRETDLLYDERYNSPENKQRVAVVIAHENAHMWFGDLVTMKWWDNLWLNEGFATLVEYFGTDNISDGFFKMQDVFLIDAVPDGMERDALASSHPLSFKIDIAREVEEAFDKISYEKGGSVLMMMRKLIGDTTFQKGLRSYLKRFSFTNARDSDLWAELDTAVRQDGFKINGKLFDFVDFANQWTKQMGFPYVTLSKLGGGKFKASQTRYKPNANAMEASKYRENSYGYKWDIPLWVSEDGVPKFYFLSRDEDLVFHSNASLVIINDGGYGFYRTNYETDEDWEEVFDKFNTLSNRTKARVVSDAFSMAEIGKISYPTLFDLLSKLKNDKEFMSWEMFNRHFNRIIGYFGNEPEEQLLKNFYANVYEGMMAKASIEYVENNYKDDKNYFEVVGQSNAIYRQCSTFDDVTCIANIMAVYDKSVKTTCTKNKRSSECSTVAAPLRHLTYCTAVQYGGKEEFDLILAMYKKELVALEKSKLLRALTCSRDIVTLKRILVDSLRPETGFVRVQDLSAVFSNVASNDIGKEFLRGFLFNHWDDLKSIGAATSILDRVIATCLDEVRTNQQLDEVKAFMKLHPETSSMSVFKTAIESAQSRIEWLDSNSKSIIDHLKKDHA